MRRHQLAPLLAALIAVRSGLPASAGDQPAPTSSFQVPGYWEPVDGRTTRTFGTPDRSGLLWHQGYRAEGRPLWAWRPPDWVPAGGSRRQFRPGLWVPADPRTREHYLAEVASRKLSAVSGENIALTAEPGWKVGYEGNARDGGFITEFIKESDNIEHWKELLTVQGFVVGSLPETPKAAFERWKQIRESRCPGQTRVRVLGEDSVSILYEWQTATECGGFPPQHEVVRWVFGPWTVFRMAYTVKQPEMPAEVRQKWVKKLSESLVVADRAPVPVGPKPGQNPGAGAAKAPSRRWTAFATTAGGPLLVALLGPDPAAGRPVQLDFTVRVETSEEPAAPAAAPESYPLRMVVGTDRLAREFQGVREVVDFRKRLRQAVNLAKKEYLDWSLYSVPLFRVMELNNRNALRSAFRAAGVKDAPDWPPTLIQHELAVSEADNPAEIRREETAARVAFSWKDRPLFEFQKAYTPASRTTMALLAQSFRYGSYGTHPRILRELEALPGVPKSITHTAHQGIGAAGKVVRTRYVLDRVSAGDESSFSVAGFAEKPPPELAEEAALIAAARKHPRGASEQVARASQGLERALAGGRYFEATLAALELYLQTGDPRWQQRVASVAAEARRDPDVRRFDAVVVPDRDHLGEAIRTLQSLRANAGSFSHVLWLSEANLQAKRRSGPDLEHAFDEARRLHLAALKVNPYNPSVWRDLGSTYQQAFETEPAFFCWDFARELAPGHPVALGLDAMKRRLEADLPEFFQTGDTGRGTGGAPPR